MYSAGLIPVSVPISATGSSVIALNFPSLDSSTVPAWTIPPVRASAETPPVDWEFMVNVTSPRLRSAVTAATVSSMVVLSAKARVSVVVVLEFMVISWFVVVVSVVQLACGHEAHTRVGKRLGGLLDGIVLVHVQLLHRGDIAGGFEVFLGAEVVEEVRLDLTPDLRLRVSALMFGCHIGHGLGDLDDLVAAQIGLAHGGLVRLSEVVLDSHLVPVSEPVTDRGNLPDRVSVHRVRDIEPGQRSDPVGGFHELGHHERVEGTVGVLMSGEPHGDLEFCVDAELVEPVSEQQLTRRDVEDLTDTVGRVM